MIEKFEEGFESTESELLELEQELLALELELRSVQSPKELPEELENTHQASIDYNLHTLEDLLDRLIKLQLGKAVSEYTKINDLLAEINALLLKIRGNTSHPKILQLVANYGRYQSTSGVSYTVTGPAKQFYAGTILGPSYDALAERA